MQRVDLGDDRLAPERVRAGEQQGGRDRRQQATRIARMPTSTMRPHASAASTAESEIHRVRAVARISRTNRRAEGEVERVAVARRDHRQRRPWSGTRRCRRDRSRAGASRDRGRTRRARRRRRAVGRAPHALSARVCAAMSARTSASGRVLRTWRGFDPAAPRGHDAELHLAFEHLGPMAVAVDGDVAPAAMARRASAPSRSRCGRRAVDFDERPRLDGRCEQPIVVELVAGSVRNQAIGRMRDQRHQRMAHRR